MKSADVRRNRRARELCLGSCGLAFADRFAGGVVEEGVAGEMVLWNRIPLIYVGERSLAVGTLLKAPEQCLFVSAGRRWRADMAAEGVVTVLYS